MGGCGMGGKETQGVTQPDGTHWQLENLSVESELAIARYLEAVEP